jgi:hypothetical protein
MKKKLLLLFVTIAFVGLLFNSSCKTAEAFVWDPSGSWTFTITYPSWSTSWVENLVFAGGVVTGFIFDGYISATAGTYTLTGDFSLRIDFDYWRSGVNDIWIIDLTSSEAAPNSMTGAGTVQYVTFYTHSFTVNANKTTNLQ